MVTLGLRRESLRSLASTALVVACTGFALALLRTPPADAQAADLSAAQILDHVSQVYASCASYADTGVVTCNHRGDAPAYTTIKTAFRRPGRLRLELTTDRPGNYRYREVIWCRDGKTKTWWDTSGSQDAASLSAALDSASTECGTAAQTVPRLLLPDEAGRSPWTGLSGVARVKDANACLRIDATLRGAQVSLWIDPTSFVLRRIDVEHPTSDVRSTEQTVYAPDIEAAVPDTALDFNPQQPVWKLGQQLAR